ncbi:MAG: hypothetical protein ABSG16_11835 [Candidatus Acidiferrum sp.]
MAGSPTNQELTKMLYSLKVYNASQMIELLLEMFLELVGEFLFELVMAVVLDLVLRAIAKAFEKFRFVNPVLASASYVLLGALAGGLSLLVFPHPLVHPSRLHGINLLVSPIATGLAIRPNTSGDI